jgi:hypothetical protein
VEIPFTYLYISLVLNISNIVLCEQFIQQVQVVTHMDIFSCRAAQVFMLWVILHVEIDMFSHIVVCIVYYFVWAKFMAEVIILFHVKGCHG